MFLPAATRFCCHSHRRDYTLWLFDLDSEQEVHSALSSYLWDFCLKWLGRSVAREHFRQAVFFGIREALRNKRRAREAEYEAGESWEADANLSLLRIRILSNDNKDNEDIEGEYFAELDTGDEEVEDFRLDRQALRRLSNRDAQVVRDFYENLRSNPETTQKDFCFTAGIKESQLSRALSHYRDALVCRFPRWRVLVVEQLKHYRKIRGGWGMTVRLQRRLRDSEVDLAQHCDHETGFNERCRICNWLLWVKDGRC